MAMGISFLAHEEEVNTRMSRPLYEILMLWKKYAQIDEGKLLLVVSLIQRWATKVTLHVLRLNGMYLGFRRWKAEVRSNYSLTSVFLAIGAYIMIIELNSTPI